MPGLYKSNYIKYILQCCPPGEKLFMLLKIDHSKEAVLEEVTHYFSCTINIVLVANAKILRIAGYLKCKNVSILEVRMVRKKEP